MTLPNFLVIGAQRSGTTWLYEQLRRHRDIWLPTQRKEVHFFLERNYHRGLDWYRGFFPTEPHDYVALGEVSPGYLPTAGVPRRIHDVLPDCKLTAILRNPVDRLYSSYGHNITHGKKISLDELLKKRGAAFRSGLYASSLARYLEVFPREQIHLLVFEHATRAPKESLATLARFLGVSAEGIDLSRSARKVNATVPPRFPVAARLAQRVTKELRRRDFNRIVNVAKRVGARRLLGRGPPLPRLQPDMRARLFERYRSEVDRLEAMFDLDLTVWRESCKMP